MTILDLGVVCTSRKENERRLPIHPEHFVRIPEANRPHVHFEVGYGLPFGVSDEQLTEEFGTVMPREDIIRQPIVLLPKPLAADLGEMSRESILWGWPHCVQQRQVTQVAIDRELTLLAFESTFTWRNGRRDHHLFNKNNELAGYCAVLHALQLAGEDGHYGPTRKAVVLSFGSVSRGAIYALLGRGYSDISVYTQRPPWSVRDQVPHCVNGQMYRARDGRVYAVESEGDERPLVEVLADADIIVNGILQDTDDPLMFIREGEEDRLRQGALIVDVSCDIGMGFPFARPTSFEEPTFAAGPTIYYAVDHTPTYLWKSATWEISAVVCEFLPHVMSGVEGWREEQILDRAVEIERGRIRNEKILSFQKRAKEYPHP